MQNNMSCKTVGVRIVGLGCMTGSKNRMHEGTRRTLTYVLYVPKLKKNINSLSVLDSN